MDLSSDLIVDNFISRDLIVDLLIFDYCTTENFRYSPTDDGYIFLSSLTALACSDDS